MSELENNLPDQLDLPPQNKLSQDNMQFEEDEINLFDLLLTLLKRKRMILTITFIAAMLSISLSLRTTAIYRAEVVLVPVGEGGKGGLSAALSNLGGLASLAGVSSMGSGNGDLNLAVLKSREFLWKFIQDEKLMPFLFEADWDADKQNWKQSDPKKQPGQWEAYRAFSAILKINKNKNTSIITVALEWKNKKKVTEWANDLVTYLNRYLGEQSIARSEANLTYLNQALMHTQVEEMRKTLFDLIAQEQKKAMIAKTQKDFAFHILDHALEPDKKSKPIRSMIVLLSTLTGFCFAVILALVLSLLQQTKKDAKANQKFAQLLDALRWQK